MAHGQPLSNGNSRWRVRYLPRFRRERLSMSHPLRRHRTAPAWPSYTGTSQYVGTSPSGLVTVYVDPSLGAPSGQNAKDLLADADRVLTANNAIFGSPGGAVSVGNRFAWRPNARP